MESYPLYWPLGYKRTHNRIHSKFKQSMDYCQRFLRDEIKRLDGRDLIISSNIPIRKDGGMYTDYMSRRMDDPGVAIYFRYKGKDIVMCCDQYLSVWENVYALAKGIEALRSMERWGVSDFMEKAFTGFAALPESATVGTRKKTWCEILEITSTATREEIKHAYREKCKTAHPDAGGSNEEFNEVYGAYLEAIKQLNP